MQNTSKYAVTLVILIFMSILVAPTMTGRISAYYAEPISFSGNIQNCSEDTYIVGRGQAVKSIIMTIEGIEYEYHIPGGSKFDSILYKGLYTIREYCKNNTYLSGSYIIEPTGIADLINRVVYLFKFSEEENKEMRENSRDKLEFLSSIFLITFLVLSFIFLYISFFKSINFSYFRSSTSTIRINKKISKKRKKINKRIELKKHKKR